MPRTFDKLGLCFQYPDNWTLDEADAVAGREAVTVYAPGGSFWSVAVHPCAAEPLQLAETVVQAMRDEYAAVEVEPTQETLGGRELVGFNMNFYYLDLTSSAEVRSLRLGDHTYTLFWQGEDREFDRLAPVFRAMAVSLLQGLAAAAGDAS
jgi:hypothetical protein